MCSNICTMTVTIYWVSLLSKALDNIILKYPKYNISLWYHKVLPKILIKPKLFSNCSSQNHNNHNKFYYIFIYFRGAWSQYSSLLIIEDSLLLHTVVSSVQTFTFPTSLLFSSNNQYSNSIILCSYHLF